MLLVTEQAQWRLGPDAGSPEAARRLVRRVLAACPPELVEAASLVVSELVTNAVLHARTAIGVAIQVLEGGGVRLEVSDDSPALPRQRRYSQDSSTGRGLVLVEALSGRWGVARWEDATGKTVWAELGPIG